jgi:hypothetical protein
MGQDRCRKSDGQRGQLLAIIAVENALGTQLNTVMGSISSQLK